MFWTRKYPPPKSPPQTVTNGQNIHGNMFPWNTKGFIRFDYNELFGNVPWDVATSWWTKTEITWEGGTIPYIDSHKKRRIYQEYPEAKIHRRWQELGYFPTYWRTALLDISQNEPINKNVKRDTWPQPYGIFYHPNQFVLIYFGTVAVHEMCRPIPWKKNTFRHDFTVNPTENCRLFNYCHYSDLMLEIIEEEVPQY